MGALVHFVFKLGLQIDHRPIIYYLKNSSDEELLILLALKNKKKRRKWVHEINEKREEFGEFHHLCRELSTYEDRFVNYFCMTREQFEEIHELVSPRISKLTTNWRKPIGTKERIAICLR
ncbi:hypothetical protein QTP88_013786 [Uroleucon formosanum]